jgi:hypothetical protein
VASSERGPCGGGLGRGHGGLGRGRASAGHAATVLDEAAPAWGEVTQDAWWQGELGSVAAVLDKVTVALGKIGRRRSPSSKLAAAA